METMYPLEFEEGITLYPPNTSVLGSIVCKKGEKGGYMMNSRGYKREEEYSTSV